MFKNSANYSKRLKVTTLRIPSFEFFSIFFVLQSLSRSQFTPAVLERVEELFVRGVDSQNFSERFRNLRVFSLVFLNKAALQCSKDFVDSSMCIGDLSTVLCLMICFLSWY